MKTYVLVLLFFVFGISSLAEAQQATKIDQDGQIVVNDNSNSPILYPGSYMKQDQQNLQRFIIGVVGMGLGISLLVIGLRRFIERSISQSMIS